MKLKSTTLLTTALISALFSLNTFADGVIGSQPILAPPVIDFVSTGTTLPMLDMQFNCGACEQNAKIKALVEGSYLDQAELENATINETVKTTLSVTHYHARGKARFFIGALAGADNITGSVNCNGIDVKVSDTAISAINGIESVARTVGKDAYRAMRECVLGKGVAETKQAPATAEEKTSEVPVTTN
jgi:hypothetical protein